MEIVSRAIERSVSHTEVVIIDEIDMMRASVGRDAVIDELYAACDDNVEGNDAHEFWGRLLDDDGNETREWRVHVRL